MSYKPYIAALAAALMLLSGCAGTAGQNAAQQDSISQEQQTQREQSAPAEQEAPTGETPAAEEATSKVADASQMTTVEDVTEEGMVPVLPESLKEGTYPVEVKSSSSMFKITDCALTVADGKMTAQLTMSSDSYGYVYPGTAEEAASAEETAYIAAEENTGGKSTFVLPVEALDMGVPCAAWSRNKELWYDRTLLFRSDSLPAEAFAEGWLVTAESLGLADGAYDVDVTLLGGSGKAGVASPCRMWVEDSAVTAEIIWSSANYDYMLVDGERYDAEIVDGHSRVLIPVSGFDRPLGVVADTTAMSQPYEIDYTLTFDAASIRPADSESRP